MDVVGIRKLIAYAMGVIGIVLVSWVGIPQEQVDSLNKALIELVPLVASIIGLVGSMFAYFRANLKEREISASTPAPVPVVAPAAPAQGTPGA